MKILETYNASRFELAFLDLLHREGLRSQFVREYRFASPRKFHVSDTWLMMKGIKRS